MAQDPADERPIGEKYRYFWPAVTAVAAVAAVAVTIVGLAIKGTNSGPQSSVTSPTPVTTSPVRIGVGPTTVAPASATGSSVALGRDLAPSESAPCAAPNVGNGAAWQLTSIAMRGRSYDPSYSCSLFPGAVGSLDFVLGASYRELDVAIGFADTSDPAHHTVRFEIIGDAKDYLTDPLTLQFGDVQDLKIDVSGVVRLRLRVSDVSPAGPSESAGRPVFGKPLLVRA